MAFEIPHDQIRELQISLRKEAAVSSLFDPQEEEKEEASSLPSLQDAISQLDPCPSYLRCSHCKGRLLRGVDSFICVFCGRQRNQNLAPDPIKFTSTFGYHWFLHSLDLDGSELVTPSVEAHESNKGQNAPEVQLPLSDLLNLEIRWPSEPEKFESVFPENKPDRPLNLAGVDVDNYFTESKISFLSTSTEGQFALSKQEDATEHNLFQGHENLSLFANFKPSETVSMSNEDETSDSFSGWEAHFQSADTGFLHQEPKFSDPFVGSTSVDLSSQMDAIFGSGNTLLNEKKKENITSASNNNDWFEGDIWSNTGAGVVVQNDQFKVSIDDKAHGSAGNTDISSSMNVSWIQGNEWQTSTSTNKATDNRTINEDDDSFDVWNDFTSSSNVQVPFSNSFEDDKHLMPSVEQTSDMSLFIGTNNSKNVDFGHFSQPDFFSSTFSNQNGSSETNIMLPQSSASDRAGSVNETDGWSIEDVETSRNIFTGNTKPKATDVETLMSQMHDLSFMLESHLSVSEKEDQENKRSI